MLEVLQGIPDTIVRAEESDIGGIDSPYVILVDPLDGTGAFATGSATSTVIAACYDTATKRLTACVIGEPAKGRIWYATDETPTLLQWHSEEGDAYAPIKVDTEWTDRNRDIGEKDYIFLDVAHGFKNGLDKFQMSAFLMTLVQDNIKFHVPGSNGLIHALVANGAKVAAGSISTAKGGPWDFCGALLVTQAGGFCRGFRKESGRLYEHDALDPVGCDFLITANSKTILDKLTVKLIASY